MTLEEQINLYNQVHDNKFYIIRQYSGYPDRLCHPDFISTITIYKNTNLETIIQLLDIYKKLSSENQLLAKVTSENILIEKVQVGTKTIAELTPHADGYVDIKHTRYQTLRQFSAKLKNNMEMTCSSLRPIAIKLYDNEQCQKEDVSNVLAQLEEKTEQQANDNRDSFY